MARKDAEFEAMEETLMEAWRVLRCSPDPERGFLASGSRSGWPEIVRDKVMDYADSEAQPRLRLGRREIALRDAVFVEPGCLMESVAVANRPLVALVLAMKTRHEPGGFRWERVWEAMGGRRSGETSDAFRMRYGRVVRDLARLWAARSGALDAACDEW
ncbi:MAG: hypothetical protein EBR82_29500 [Caulobacteraceae bacterium]|nr:hypothetical protein [Caulobacteraceae bacterium]